MLGTIPEAFQRLLPVNQPSSLLLCIHLNYIIFHFILLSKTAQTLQETFELHRITPFKKNIYFQLSKAGEGMSDTVIKVEVNA